jgi:hypothetical protein
MSEGVLEGERYRVALKPAAAVSSPQPAPGEEGDRYGAWLGRAKPLLDAYFTELAGDIELPLVRFANEHDEVAGIVAGVDDRDAFDSQLVRSKQRGKPFLVRVQGTDLLPGHDALELCIVVSRRIRHSRLEAILRRVAEIMEQARAEAVAGPLGPAGLAPGSGDDPRPTSFFGRVRRWIRGGG